MREECADNGDDETDREVCGGSPSPGPAGACPPGAATQRRFAYQAPAAVERPAPLSERCRKAPDDHGRLRGSSAAVTDSLPRFAATTERLVGTNAVFAGAEINNSGDFVRNSEGFAIATLYKMRSQ